MFTPNRSAKMVVIEFSAAWPQWLQPTGAHMSVVAQQYEGPPGSLVTQVASRTARLETVGWRLDTLVLVSSGRTDPDSVAARSILARGLVARLRALGHGSLLLALDDKAGARAGSQLRGLASSLDQAASGANIQLAVRIGERVWSSRPGVTVATEPGGLDQFAAAG